MFWQEVNFSHVYLNGPVICNLFAIFVRERKFISMPSVLVESVYVVCSLLFYGLW